MNTLNIEISTDIYTIMERHKEIDWQRIAQKYLTEYARKISLADSITKSSTLTDEDIIELDEKIKADIYKNFNK